MIDRIGIWIIFCLFTFLQRDTVGSSIADKCTDTTSYDVTKNMVNVDSHDSYGTRTYPANTVQCMDIYTKAPDHVVKLKVKEFDIEGSDDEHICSDDYLRIYDNSIQSAGVNDLLGEYCDIAPKEVQSSSQSLFLYFKTDRGEEERGFRFEASSVAKPVSDKSQIISIKEMIAIGGAVGVIPIIAGVAYFIKFIVQKKKKGGCCNGCCTRDNVDKDKNSNKAEDPHNMKCCFCCIGSSHVFENKRYSTNHIESINMSWNPPPNSAARTPSAPENDICKRVQAQVETITKKKYGDFTATKVRVDKHTGYKVYLFQVHGKQVYIKVEFKWQNRTASNVQAAPMNKKQPLTPFADQDNDNLTNNKIV